MSEIQSKKIEVLESSKAEKDSAPEVKLDSAEISREKSKQAEQLSEARQEVTKETDPHDKDKILDKLKVEEDTPDRDVAHMPAGSELKKATFQKEIKHIRRKLKKTEQLGSRVIHQPFVRNVSEVSAKTVTRPSGLLGGGITAFLGTSIYLYMSKHLGLKYNYAVFLLLLVGGFILGLIIEALYRMARGSRSV